MAKTNKGRLTKKQAGEIVEKSCFRIKDIDSRDYGREILHCFLGMFGADWDKDDIMRLIAKSKDRAWIEGQMLGHELAILGDNGKAYYFDVKRKNYEDQKGRNGIVEIKRT